MSFHLDFVTLRMITLRQLCILFLLCSNTAKPSAQWFGSRDLPLPKIGQVYQTYEFDPSIIDFDLSTTKLNSLKLTLPEGAKTDPLLIKSPVYGEAYPVIGQADFMTSSSIGSKYYLEKSGKLILKGEQTDFFGFQSNPIRRYEYFIAYDPQMFDQKLHNNTVSIIELSDYELQKMQIKHNTDKNRYLIHQEIEQVFTPSSIASIYINQTKFQLKPVRLDIYIKNSLYELPYDENQEIKRLTLNDSIKHHSSFQFYSDTQIFPLLELQFDGTSQQLKKITYRTQEKSQSARLVDKGVTDFVLEPNPGFGKTTMMIHLQNSGIYTIEIKNILGQQLFQQQYNMNENEKLDLDFSNLPKGSYFCNLLDQSGRILVSKKLIILKP